MSERKCGNRYFGYLGFWGVTCSIESDNPSSTKEVGLVDYDDCCPQHKWR